MQTVIENRHWIELSLFHGGRMSVLVDAIEVISDAVGHGPCGMVQAGGVQHPVRETYEEVIERIKATSGK